jgi:prepilin-type N-terminal cleavage/methylation domain-containing protein
MIKKGFTLVEILIVFSIMAILATTTVGVYKSWQNRNVLSSAKQTVSQALREAQALASTGTNDSNWGVKLMSKNLVLFNGASYSERNINNDKIFDLPSNILIEGLDEVTFSKISGLPGKEINITITYDGAKVNIGLNAQGVLSY